MRFALLKAALLILFAAASATAQTINPQTQIRWPANCNAAGVVYNFFLNTCIPAGGGGGGGVTNFPLTFNGTNTGGAIGAAFNGGVALSIGTNSINAPNLSVPNTFGAGFLQTVTPSATNAGLRLAPFSGNPSTCTPGQVNYNATDDRLNFQNSTCTWQEISQVSDNPAIFLPTGLGHQYFDCTVTAAVASVACVGAHFANANIGQVIGIPYAGANNGTLNVGKTLVTTITAVSGCIGGVCTGATLAAAPSTSISGPRTVTDIACSVNQSTLNSAASANWAPGDIGKIITVPGAGLPLSNSGGSPQTAWINGVTSATAASFNRKCLSTITAGSQTATLTGAEIIFGPDQTAIIQTAINQGCANHQEVVLNFGIYLTTLPIFACQPMLIRGQGPYSSTIAPVGGDAFQVNNGISGIYYDGGSTINNTTNNGSIFWPIINPGSGYAPGDRVSEVGLSGTGGYLLVGTVNGSGGITSWNSGVNGTATWYQAWNVATTTNGAGTGATMDVMVGPVSGMQIRDIQLDLSGVRVNTYGTQNKCFFVRPTNNMLISNVYAHDSSATCLGPDWTDESSMSNNLVVHGGAQVNELGGSGGGSCIGIGTGMRVFERQIYSNNTVTDCGAHGLFFESQSSTILSRGIRAIGNHCAWLWSNSDCLGDHGTQGTVWEANQIEFSSVGFSAQTGFVGVIYSTDFIFANNYLANNTTGMLISSSAGVNGTISGNTLAGGYSFSTPPSSIGIQITNVTGTGGVLRFINNVLENFGSRCFYQSAGALGVVDFKGNTINNCGLTGTDRPAYDLFAGSIATMNFMGNSVNDTAATHHTNSMLLVEAAGTITNFNPGAGSNTYSGLTNLPFQNLGTITNYVGPMAPLSGQQALTGGAATVTLSQPYISNTTFFCSAFDVTIPANAVTCTPASASTITLAGIGTDNVQWSTTGR